MASSGIIAQLKNQVSFQVDQSSINAVNSAMNEIKSMATKLLGTIGITLTLSNLKSLTEEFSAINDKINYAVGYSEDMLEVQESILEAANESRVSYESMADAVVTLSQANSDVFPIEDATTFVECVNKLGQAAGYSDSEISAMHSTLQQIASTGEATSTNISTILRSYPALANQLASALETTTDELSDMADEGELTAEVIRDAITDSAEEIDEAFSNIDFTISDAVQNIRNQWGYWINDMDELLDLTQTIAKLMVSGFNKVMGVLQKVRDGTEWLSEKLGGTENLLKAVAIVAGTLFAVFQFDKIQSALQAVGKLLGNINLKTLLIAAAIAAVLLVIDDIVNFMQGNNSAIGVWLEEAGVDCDELREKIKTVWENIKTIVSNVVSAVADIIKNVFKGIATFIDNHGTEIAGIFEAAVDAILGFTDSLANGMEGGFGVIGDILDAFGISVDGLPGLISAAFDTIVNVVTGLGETLSGMVDDVFGVFQQWWDENGESFVESVTGLFSQLEEWWNEWGPRISDSLGAVWDGLTGMIQPLLDALQGLIDFLTNVFAGNWSGVWESAFDIIDGIAGSISSVLNGLFDAIQNLFGEDSFLGGLISKVQSWFNDTGEIVSNGIETLSEQGDTVVENLSETADEVSGIWDNVKESASNLWGNIKESLGFEEAEQSGEDMAELMAQGIEEGTDDVAAAVDEMGNIIESRAGFSVPEEGPLSDADSWMPDMMDLFASGITDNQNVVTSALEQVMDAADQEMQELLAGAYDWGVDLMQNMIDGMNSMQSSLAETASSIASTVDAYLGFSIPEKGPLSDFDESMPDMISLMTSGMEEGQKSLAEAASGIADTLNSYLRFSLPDESGTPLLESVFDSLSSVSGNIFDAVSDGLSGIAFGGQSGDDNAALLETVSSMISAGAAAATVSPATAGAVTNNSSTSNKNVVQNVTINNTFSVDKSAQQTMATAMGSAADDATSEMARAMAYL